MTSAGSREQVLMPPGCTPQRKPPQHMPASADDMVLHWSPGARQPGARQRPPRHSRPEQQPSLSVQVSNSRLHAQVPRRCRPRRRCSAPRHSSRGRWSRSPRGGDRCRCRGSAPRGCCRASAPQQSLELAHEPIARVAAEGAPGSARTSSRRSRRSRPACSAGPARCTSRRRPRCRRRRASPVGAVDARQVAADHRRRRRSCRRPWPCAGTRRTHSDSPMQHS